jgi:hypothetical protein
MPVLFTGEAPACFDEENRMSSSLINLQTLTQDAWPSVALRRLGSFEHLFWLMDQDRPVHFGMVAEISGKTTPTDWRRALASVQRRHPLLSAYIEADPSGVPRFRRSPSAPIPLRAITGEPESDWHRVLAEELVTPFDFGHAPLVRAVLIQGDGGAAFMLLMHHAIGDSLAAAYVIRDALLALAGDSLEALPIAPSQDELIRGGVAPTQTQNGAAQPAPPAKPMTDGRGNLAIPKVQSLRLPAEFTAKLRARAREEGSSVHGALCAAVVVAGRERHAAWRDIPVRIISPIQTRTMQDIGEGCGCYLSSAAHSFETGAAYFWDLARLAKLDVSQAKNPQSVNGLVREVQSSLAGGLDVAGVADFVATAFAHDAMISNIGELPFANQFGNIKLEAIWGPAVLGRFDDTQFIGAATLDGALCLTHTSQTQADGLLEMMQSALVKACLA